MPFAYTPCIIVRCVITRKVRDRLSGLYRWVCCTLSTKLLAKNYKSFQRSVKRGCVGAPSRWRALPVCCCTEDHRITAAAQLLVQFTNALFTISHWSTLIPTLRRVMRHIRSCLRCGVTLSVHLYLLMSPLCKYNEIQNSKKISDK